MTNWKYVIAGNCGEVLGWQLVLFPLSAFFLVKAKRVGRRRGDEFRRWKCLDILVAELTSYCILLLVAALFTFLFDKQKVMYDPDVCLSSDECRKGSLITSDERKLNTSENVFVTLYYMKGNSSGKLRNKNVTILYTHGNSGNVASHLPRVTYMNLLYMGVNVIAWDPPGFGLSSGTPSYAAWMSAAETVIEEVNKTETNVILYGRSLGGAVSVLLAARHYFRGIILESPLDSMQKLFLDFFRLTAFVMSPIWQDSYNAFDSINEISSCLFQYAAEDDELITDYRQKRLNDQAGSKRGNCSYFVVGEGKQHNDVAWDLNYKNKLTEFLEKTVSFRS